MFLGVVFPMDRVQVRYVLNIRPCADVQRDISTMSSHATLYHKLRERIAWRDNVIKNIKLHAALAAVGWLVVREVLNTFLSNFGQFVCAFSYAEFHKQMVWVGDFIMCNNRTTNLYISKRAGSDNSAKKITRLIAQFILSEQYLGTYVLKM